MLAHALALLRSSLHETVKRHLRSPRWRAVEREHLKAEPFCRGCGTIVRLQVHHILPFAAHPELELDPANLITLCMGANECHERIGHGGNFACYNPNVRRDAFEARMRPKRRPEIERRAKEARLPSRASV
jgi:5-methylcytosine-specific restriction protein A